MQWILLVIDYRNDFVDGALGFPGAKKRMGKLPKRFAPKVMIVNR